MRKPCCRLTASIRRSMTTLRGFLIPLAAVALWLPDCLPDSFVGEMTLGPGPETNLRKDISLTKGELHPENTRPLTETDCPASLKKLSHVSTVASPRSPSRPIRLAECLALALENGRTGEFFDAAGSERRTSVTGAGRAASPADSSDSVRVFAYDPAMLATETEQSLGRFELRQDLPQSVGSPPRQRPPCAKFARGFGAGVCRVNSLSTNLLRCQTTPLRQLFS